MNLTTISTLATNALIGTTILGLAALCLSLVLQRFSAATRHYYWLMIITCLLMLPALSSIAPKYRVEVPSQAMVVQPNSTPEITSHIQASPSMEESSQIGIIPISPALEPGLKNPSRAKTIASKQSSKPFDLRQSLLLTWTIGSTFIVLWITAGWLRIKHLISQSTSINEGKIVIQCDTISKQMKVKRRFNIMISKRTLMPMVVGIRNATLILPAGFENWDPTKQTAVLAHEIGHVQRYDCSTQLLGQLLCALYWFHPISWLINRKLQTEAEAACDDLAIESGTSPSQYAEHLLTIARSLKGLRILPGTTAQMAGYSKLQNRLRRILNRGMNRNQLTRMSALVCTIATVTGALLFSTIRITASNTDTSEASPALKPAEPQATSPKTDSIKEPKVTLSVKELNQLARFASLQSAATAQQTAQNQEKSNEPETRKSRNTPLAFSGTIESASAVTIRSQLVKPSTILWRAHEGALVEKGDLILEFESDHLVDELETKKIELAQDEGKINAAQSLLDNLRKNEALEIETGELNLRLTELKQQKGQADFKLRLKKSESDLNIAIKRLEEAEAALKTSQAQQKAGVAGPDKVRSASIAMEEAKYKIELASDTRENLLNHDRIYEDVEHKLTIHQAKSALHNNLTESETKIASAEAEINSLLAIRSIKATRIERIERLIKASKVLAPFTGKITYSHTDEASYAPSKETVYKTGPGSIIRKHQPIIGIRDTNNLVVRFDASLEAASRIKLGQIATISLDGTRKASVEGKVTDVSEPIIRRSPSYTSLIGNPPITKNIQRITVRINPSPSPLFQIDKYVRLELAE